ncbi:MAG: serine O-acetyltransferase [Pseudomonadota bacterium]
MTVQPKHINLACAEADDACVWSALRQEAAAYAVKEVAMSSMLHAIILEQDDLGDAIVNHLSDKLATSDFPTLKMRKVLSEAVRSDPGIVPCIARDLQAVKERDPACHTHLQCFLFFKGFLAIQTHRLAHALHAKGRDLIAYQLKIRYIEIIGVDINPAATVGCGIMLDHATGFVMGETARLGDDCSILQGVTLGGTGKSDEDRHPKIGNRVLIGANASVLGNIQIGDGAKIAAGSVVLKDVPENCTVAGVPAKAVGGSCGDPAAAMDQSIS